VYSSTRFGKLGRRHLVAEVSRPQGEQLDKRSRRKVGLHELLRAGECERGLQLTVDFGEKQGTARPRPVIEGGEPSELIIVVASCEPQRDAGGWPGGAGCVDASTAAVPQQSREHRSPQE
jgi:hypothetical protein